MNKILFQAKQNRRIGIASALIMLAEGFTLFSSLPSQALTVEKVFNPKQTHDGWVMDSEAKISQITHNYGSIKVIDGKIILGDRLQQELQQKIILANAELQNISKKLAIDYSEKISLGYLHLGQNNWELKFTFGGIILNTSAIIILSTDQVFTLKKFFQATDSLMINNHKYQTTKSMIQFGPILHERAK